MRLGRAAVRSSQAEPPVKTSVVAVDPLTTFVTLLRLDRQSGGRAGLKASQADRLAGVFAIAIGAVLDPAQGLIDLGDQLALTVTGPKFQRTIRFRRGPVHQVGVVFGLGFQIGDRTLRFTKDIVLPGQELVL